jgi:hypothetical protein
MFLPRFKKKKKGEAKLQTMSKPFHRLFPTPRTLDIKELGEAGPKVI